MDNKTKIKELIILGTEALRDREHPEAERYFSEGLTMDPNDAELWAGRSAAKARQTRFEDALVDAEKAIELRPDWGMGYSRKAHALTYLCRLDEALQNSLKAIQLDPDNEQFQVELQNARDSLAELQGQPDKRVPFVNPFSDPDFMAKLMQNSKTEHLPDDEDFLAKLEILRNNPVMLPTLVRDPKIMLALGSLMNLQVNMEGPADTTPSVAATKPPKKHVEKMETASVDEQKAMEEKELGNAAYKKRDFETAISHYEKAIRLNPAEMAFLCNLAAAHFEQGELVKCVDNCLRAVDVGRENRADYKRIAKAFSRCALAYSKLEDYQQAKIYYQKSISEHRVPETVTRLSEVEKKLKEKIAAAYMDPVKADEERTRGNELFKKGQYSDAVKAYTEAIRRNPNDPKIYSNRAACYTKLAAFDLGVKDCDKCIELDPTFIKGHIRKGNLLKGMQKFDKAMEAFQKAIELDENNTEAINGYRECMLSRDHDPDQVKKRALSDPEVQEILRDPGMRLILEQMQEDPMAAREHLKNPEIAAKIQKLVQSGLIAFH